MKAVAKVGLHHVVADGAADRSEEVDAGGVGAGRYADVEGAADAEHVAAVDAAFGDAMDLELPCQSLGR